MNSKKYSLIKKASIGLFLAVSLITANVSNIYARPFTPPPLVTGGRVCNPDTSPDANIADSFSCILANAVAALLEIGAVIALIAVIINGIKIATAGGDPKTIADAKKSLTFAIIGALVAVGGVFLVWFIGNLIGITGDFRNVDLSPN